ncbi:hypothetical protein AB685_17585 [Bacillus sp. LL01]|uniref:S16 family serine protease n=1 Tax=Bacillus sp. LL01 TaxID=1665556 RepID=UPI00064CF9CA|nr:S16 family serine protease [Bacillus sp. LL01]KMJ57216.1 hypothetical protein AB685_17585 [Bacillus sp. LL01]
MDKPSILKPFVGTTFIYSTFLYLYLFDYLTGMDFALLLLLLLVTNVVFIFVSLNIKALRRSFIFSALLSFILFNYEFSTFVLDEKESIVTFYQPSEEIVPNTGIYVLGIGSVELEKGATITFYNKADLYEDIAANNIIRYRSKNEFIFELLHVKKSHVEDMRKNVYHYLEDTNSEIEGFLNREDINGSSAGLALVLSSILHEGKGTNELSIGVTGAINKNGKVKNVESINGKVQTAARDGHTHVIVPYGNLKEALKAKEDFKLNVKIAGVKSVEEALAVIEIWHEE